MAIVTLLAGPAAAQVVVVERWVEEWDPASQSWVRIDEPVPGAERFVLPARPDAPRAALAHYGPFRVLDETRVEMVGPTDSQSPAAFAAMLRDYPALARIDMVECSGTFDDVANLQLGRMIRAAGIATHVPRGGSVRSGAVELFLAGTVRSIEDGAQFAVHSWIDNFGRQPGDYAADAPENQTYLAYYREMGMTPGHARAFYDMTNSVPHEQALWLDAADMRGWVTTAAGPDGDAPRLADLDLSAALN